MKNFELELREYILGYCDAKNIAIDLRFACFGDTNEFYTHDIKFGVNYTDYYTEDFEDIKNFFRHYLDIMWSNCKKPMNKIALYIKDIVDMDSWYEVIVGGSLFEDEALI